MGTDVYSCDSCTFKVMYCDDFAYIYNTESAIVISKKFALDNSIGAISLFANNKNQTIKIDQIMEDMLLSEVPEFIDTYNFLS